MTIYLIWRAYFSRIWIFLCMKHHSTCKYASNTHLFGWFSIFAIFLSKFEDCRLLIASSGRRRRAHLPRLQRRLYRAVAGHCQRQEYRAYRAGEQPVVLELLWDGGGDDLVAAAKHVSPARLTALRLDWLLAGDDVSNVATARLSAQSLLQANFCHSWQFATNVNAQCHFNSGIMNHADILPWETFKEVQKLKSEQKTTKFENQPERYLAIFWGIFACTMVLHTSK